MQLCKSFKWYIDKNWQKQQKFECFVLIIVKLSFYNYLLKVFKSKIIY